MPSLIKAVSSRSLGRSHHSTKGDSEPTSSSSAKKLEIDRRTSRGRTSRSRASDRPSSRTRLARQPSLSSVRSTASDKASNTRRGRYDVDLPHSKRKQLTDGKKLSSRRLLSGLSIRESKSKREEKRALRSEAEGNGSDHSRRRRASDDALSENGDFGGSGDGDRASSRKTTREHVVKARRRQIRIEGGPMSPSDSSTNNRPAACNRMSSDASVGSTGSNRSAVTSATLQLRKSRDPLGHARRLTHSRHGGPNESGEGNAGGASTSGRHVASGDGEDEDGGDTTNNKTTDYVFREEELVVCFGKRTKNGQRMGEEEPGEKWRKGHRVMRNNNRRSTWAVGDDDDDDDGGDDGAAHEEKDQIEELPKMAQHRFSDGDFDDEFIASISRSAGSLVTGAGEGAAASMRSLRSRVGQSILNLQDEEHNVPSSSQSLSALGKTRESPPPSPPVRNGISIGNLRGIGCGGGVGAGGGAGLGGGGGGGGTTSVASTTAAHDNSRRPSFGNLMSGLASTMKNAANLGQEIEVTHQTIKRRDAKAAAAASRRSTSKSIVTASTDVSGLTTNEWEGLDEPEPFRTRPDSSDDNDDSVEDGEENEDSDDATTVYGPDMEKRRQMFQDDTFEVVDGLITLAGEKPEVGMTERSDSGRRSGMDKRGFSFKSAKSVGSLFLG